MWWQHLAGLLWISKMKNLANDISKGWDLLTVKDIWNDGEFVFPSYMGSMQNLVSKQLSSSLIRLKGTLTLFYKFSGEITYQASLL